MAVLCTARAHAQDASEISALLSETVVTTASTTAQKASNAPATSVTITGEELRTYGVRSLAEAIDFLSLGVVTAERLQTPDIGARGVLLPNDAGKHFLVLVDGHALNDPLYGAARFDQGLGVPLDLIDRVEVIVGPGSVLYGSNAMLGVVHVFTKRASDYRGGHALGEYEPGRSWTAGAGTGLELDVLGETAALTLGLEHYERFGPNLDFDQRYIPINPAMGQPMNYRRGEPADGVWGGTLEHAYFTRATSARLRLRIGDFEASVSANAYRRGVPYLSPSVNVDFDSAESYELDRSLRLDLSHQVRLSATATLTSRLYADGFDYHRRVNRNAMAACFTADFETCSYYDVGVAQWVGLEERLALDWFADGSLTTLFGIDARQRRVRAKQDALDFDTDQPFAPTRGHIEESAFIISPYLQQTYSPAPWLDLNAGVRLDADARFSPVLSPRGAAVLRPFDKTTLKGIYSEAFRTPTWSETSLSNYRLAAVEQIETEKVRSVEGSIEQRFGAQRLLFGVFRTWWDNLVRSDQLSHEQLAELQSQGKLPITTDAIVYFHNGGGLHNYGYNARWTGSVAHDQLSYGLSATAAFTRAQGPELDGDVLGGSPRLFGNAHLAYKLGRPLPTLGLAGSYVSARPADAAFDKDWPDTPYAPALAQLRATLSGAVPHAPGLGYRLSAAYTTAAHGAYVAGPYPSNFTPGVDAILMPVDRFRAFAGLRYDFGSGSSDGQGD